MPIRVNITPAGQLSLPADILERLSLADGGTVIVEETNDGVVLRTAAQAVCRAQAVAKRYAEGKVKASVDTFLADRRAESGE